MALKRFNHGPKLLVDFGNEIIDLIQPYLPMPGAGTPLTRYPGGTLLPAGQGGTSSPAINTPFQIFATKNLTGMPPTWDGTYNVTLWPGSVNQLLPTNIFAKINQTITSTQYVVLTCLSDGYVVTSSTWSLMSSQPTTPDATADIPPSIFYITLGVIFYNSTPNTISIFQIWFDNPSCTPFIWTTTSRTGAGPYELAYVNYYNWNVA